MSASGSFNYQFAQPLPLCLAVLLFIKIKLQMWCDTALQGDRKVQGKERKELAGSCTAVFCGIVNQSVIVTCENILYQQEKSWGSWDGWRSWGRVSVMVEKKYELIKDRLLPLICVFQPTGSNIQIIIDIQKHDKNAI